MIKWQIENSETSEISEILEILFRVILFPSFRFCPTAKIENSDLKISGKNFPSFPSFPRFPTFPTFRPGLLAQLVPFPYSQRNSPHYSDRMHDISVTIPRCYKDVQVKSFLPRTDRLWNSLPIKCIPFKYDLNGLKSRINRHFN